jgi:aspartate-semialdehyde dehydrogenase
MTAGPPAGNPSFPVAIVEPTTLLGRDVRAALTERKFPASRVHLFHQAAGDTGLLAADEDEVAFVAPLTPDALETCRIAFLCGRAADTARFLATRVDGALAIDLSGVRNGQALVVPSEAGESRTLSSGNLFLMPHPVAFVLAETIRLVESLAPVIGVTAAVDRPASELGKAALDELFQQALALVTFRPLPKDVLETQGVFNFWVPPDSHAFEKSVADDLAALLGRSIPTSILSARSGVFHGHFLRIELRLGGDAPQARDLLASFRAQKHAFDIVDPENLSGPVESAGRDETLLLRCETSDQRVALTLASDHLRRAGALLAVRLAEQVAQEREWLRPQGGAG